MTRLAMGHNARGGDFAVGLFFCVLRESFASFASRIWFSSASSTNDPAPWRCQFGDITMTWRPCAPTMLRVLVRAGDRPTLLSNQKRIALVPPAPAAVFAATARNGAACLMAPRHCFGARAPSAPADRPGTRP